jgi:tetratricopeptide (TPR) repeat protein
MYFADGQIQDEVYVYGSFLQSRMFHEGVVCTDCHDAHSLKRHAEGNALCARCHEPEKYDRKEHHFHEPGTEGSYCIECHMPERTYMVVDPRADHSIRVPRPDLSVELGTPNACNLCHDDKTAAWSAEHVAEWYGEGRIRGPHYGQALHAARSGAAGAADALTRLVLDTGKPAIARATALEALSGGYPRADLADTIRRLVGDPEPLVRAEAARAIEMLPLEERPGLALPLLDDPVRLVRLEAAWALADTPLDRLPKEQRMRVRVAFEEYEKSQRVNADRAAAHANLALYHLRRGHPKTAEKELLKAVEMEPTDLRSWVNLADLYRTLDRDRDAEAVLRRALLSAPKDAALHHVLGLTLVRLHRYDEALASLRTAAELLPENPRFTLVYAVALRDTGDPALAAKVLRAALTRHPDHAGLRRLLESLK